MVAETKSVSASASTASAERTPRRAKKAAPIPPRAIGPRKLRRRFSSEARRQAMSGPTPIRKMSERKRGTFTWLKKGAPTLTFTPRSASDSSGNTVPKKTVKAAATRKTLLSRKADSRETTESSSPSERSASHRQARSPSATSTTTPRNVRKKAPMAPWVKARTGERDPGVADAAGDERRHGEGEGHGEPGEAQVKGEGMGDHPRVLEQWVQPAPVGRDWHQALEGRRRNGHHAQEEGQHAQHDHQHPGVELARPLAVAEDHDQREEREHPAPQDDRALEGAPDAGDPVVEGRAKVGGLRHVAHGEVEVQEGVDEQREGEGDQPEDAQRRVLGRFHQRGVPAAGAHGRPAGAVHGQRQRHDQRALAQLRRHEPGLRSDLMSSL